MLLLLQTRGAVQFLPPELLVVNEAKRASAHRLKPFGDSTEVFQDSITVHQDD